MARSLWNGVLTFGVLHVPVKLHTATHSETIRFREVHLPDGGRIEHRKFCSEEDVEVDKDEVVRGYEVAEGKWVVVEDDEAKAAAGDPTHEVSVAQFADLAELDPVLFDKAYYLGCGDGGEEVYRLLHDALEETGRAAIGRFTFHNRERLCAVRAYDGVLVLHVLRFADELVAADEVDLDAPKKKPGEREVAMAGRLVESLEAPFTPDEYEDTHREAVLRLIEAKRKGEDITPPEPEPADDSDDLLASLEASLAGARS